MSRVLVLAANSFVGQPLVQELRKRGHQVSTASRSGTTDLRCDLTRSGDIEAAIRDSQPEVVVNCAGATTSRDPETLYEVHLSGARRLLDTVRQQIPKALTVLFGSAAEYGPVDATDLPVSEQLPERPAGFFGASKLAQTHLAQAAAAEWGLSSLVLRPFNIVGPGSPDHYLPGALVRRLNRRLAEGRLDQPMAIQNGQATRDFIDVRDVATATADLIEHHTGHPTASCEIYNIGSSRETTVLDLARGLGALAAPSLPIENAGKADSRSAVSRSLADTTKLRRTTPWKPKFDLETSLQDLWQSSQRFPKPHH